MPIYMDRHNMPEGVTAEDVEQAHHADMHVQDKYKVNFLTYWFDQKADAVFCLADAPHGEAIKKVHGESHGNIPNDIIEVDLSDVEAFLGSITNSEKDASGQMTHGSPLRSILFTDLEGSTEMTTTLGDAEAVALFGIHDQIIRDTLAAHNGHEVKHTGDGFMAAFAEVEDSVKCAIAIQHALQEFNNSGVKRPLRVRIGINAGQPVERGNDLFGMAVNLAARICDHADAGQVLVTGVVHELLGTDHALQAKLNECQKAYFKGFSHAIQIYQIDWSTP